MGGGWLRWAGGEDRDLGLTVERTEGSGSGVRPPPVSHHRGTGRGGKGVGVRGVGRDWAGQRTEERAGRGAGSRSAAGGAQKGASRCSEAAGAQKGAFRCSEAAVRARLSCS